MAITDKSVEQILQRVDQLAAKLGVTAEHLWEVLLRQARVELYSACLWAAVIFAAIVALSCLLPRLNRNRTKENEKGYHRSDGPAVLFYGNICLVAFLLIILLNVVTTAITLAANPEYWALHQILKTLGGAR